MAPPAAGPLIQGSTTPMAKETATAASTASPPAASTLAPTSAARRCAAATTPPRVGITALRMIWVREKLSIWNAENRTGGSLVGWVERSETHLPTWTDDRFRYAQPILQ